MMQLLLISASWLDKLCMVSAKWSETACRVCCVHELEMDAGSLVHTQVARFMG